MVWGFRGFGFGGGLAVVTLFFVRGGRVDPYNQLFYGAGQFSLYWSSRAHSSSSDAYRFYFNNSSIDPSGNYYRYGGFPFAA